MFRTLGYLLEDMSAIKISNGGLEYYIARADKGYSECCDSSMHWLGCHNPGMWESSQSVERCSTACPVYNLKEGDDPQILQESSWPSERSSTACSEDEEEECLVYNLKEGDDPQILQESSWSGERSSTACPWDESLEEENALSVELDRIEREELDRVKSISKLEKYRTYNVRRLEGDEEVSEDEDEPNIITLDYVGRVHLPGKNFGARYRSRFNASQRGLIYLGEGEYELFKW